MSMINISFDTKQKTCSITMNGQILTNVSNVYIDKYEVEDDKEESHIEITMREIMEDDGMAKVTRLYASKDKEGAVSIDELEVYANKQAEALLAVTKNWLSGMSKNK